MSAVASALLKERDEAYAERDLHIRAAGLMEQEIEKLRAALKNMPEVVRRTTVCQGPSWPDDRPGVWIAALTACENAVREAVDAALAEVTPEGNPK